MSTVTTVASVSPVQLLGLSPKTFLFVTKFNLIMNSLNNKPCAFSFLQPVGVSACALTHSKLRC